MLQSQASYEMDGSGPYFYPVSLAVLALKGLYHEMNIFLRLIKISFYIKQRKL
jgi:hypothetical protein